MHERLDRLQQKGDPMWQQMNGCMAILVATLVDTEDVLDRAAQCTWQLEYDLGMYTTSQQKEEAKEKEEKAAAAKEEKFEKEREEKRNQIAARKATHDVWKRVLRDMISSSSEDESTLTEMLESLEPNQHKIANLESDLENITRKRSPTDEKGTETQPVPPRLRRRRVSNPHDDMFDTMRPLPTSRRLRSTVGT